MDNKLQYWIELNHVKLFYKIFFEVDFANLIEWELNQLSCVAKNVLNDWKMCWTIEVNTERLQLLEVIPEVNFTNILQPA